MSGPANVASKSGIIKPIVIVSAFSVAILGIFGSYLIVRYGSLNAGINAMRGEQVSLEPSHIEAGIALKGTRKVFSVILTNNLDTAVTILGGTSSCKCVATKGLPIVLPPHGSAQLPIHVHFTGDPGPFRQYFEFQTNAEADRRILGRVSGAVAE
jgi:hypothetical protein